MPLLFHAAAALLTRSSPTLLDDAEGTVTSAIESMPPRHSTNGVSRLLLLLA